MKNRWLYRQLNPEVWVWLQGVLMPSSNPCVPSVLLLSAETALVALKWKNQRLTFGLCAYKACVLASKIQAISIAHNQVSLY